MKRRHCIYVRATHPERHPPEAYLRAVEAGVNESVDHHGLSRPPCVRGGAEVSEPEPAQGEEWGVVRVPALDLAEVEFSIQVPRQERRLVCPRCNTLFLAAGPTGHEAGRPICDLCLLEGSHELGTLLALASTARVFGAFDTEDPMEYVQALGDYGAFAKVYELIAARSGPPRLFPSVVPATGS